MNSKLLAAQPVWRNLLPIPNPSPTVQTCTVVFQTCQEVVVQKKRLASLGQASVKFVHANNPIPKVSGNRISRFRASIALSGLAWLFADL
jgi:hypothetical protein